MCPIVDIQRHLDIHDHSIIAILNWAKNQNKLNTLIGANMILLLLGLRLSDKLHQKKYAELQAEIEELKHAKEE